MKNKRNTTTPPAATSNPQSTIHNPQSEISPPASNIIPFPGRLGNALKPGSPRHSEATPGPTMPRVNLAALLRR